MAQHQPPAIFVADAPALDFLNSVAIPVDEVIDWLDDGEGLLDWLGQASLVPDEVVASFRKRTTPGELDRVAQRARELREWFRDFVLAHRGLPLSADAITELAPLNRILERDESFSQLVQVPGSSNALALRSTRRWNSPEALLLPIGEMLARLVSEEDFTDVKACEGHNCTLLFADHTRRRTRRWCSMAVCGNRAKQAAHRNRSKSQH